MSGPTPSKLRYKHVVMVAHMLQPYIRQYTDIRRQSREDDKVDDREVGMQLFEQMIVTATDDVTKLLASIMDTDEESVGELGLDELLDWFEATWEANNVQGFIERVRGLTKKFSQSQLQNLSNATTAGEKSNSKKRR